MGMNPIANSKLQAIQNQSLVKLVTYLQERDRAVVVRIARVAFLLLHSNNSGNVEGSRHRSRVPTMAKQRQEQRKTDRCAQHYSYEFSFDGVRPRTPVRLEAWSSGPQLLRGEGVFRYVSLRIKGRAIR